MAKLKYQVRETIFDDKSMLDELNFYHQEQGKVSELTKTLTYMLGDYNKNYPISMATQGNIGSPNSAVEVDDVQFSYPIMGRDDKASPTGSTSYSAGDKPGLGHSLFTINMQDNWIKRFYKIESPNNVQARVMTDPIQVGNEWQYTCQLDPAEYDSYCPLSELQPGTLWVGLWAPVAESESTGTDTKMAMPGSMKNQMGFIRHSFSWAGNSPAKMMNIEVQTESGKTKVWMDYAMWQNEKRWLEEREQKYWRSRYNRLADSRIPLKDLLTGKVIPEGSGVYEQIQNKSTFSTLTYSSMSNKIGDALFGQSDSGGMRITLYTGLGGLQDFDNAMKEQGKVLLTDFTGIADKFVSGGMNDLMLGGYFKGFYHVDGYVIKVVHNPIQDMGTAAMKSPPHPVTGYPLESHRLTFIDDNDYDGQPNIQHIAQKDRAFLHGIVSGLTKLPKSLKIMGGFNLSGDQVQLLSHEVDKSSYHRFHSCGIQMLRANKCFDMQCIAGL